MRDLRRQVFQHRKQLVQLLLGVAGGLLLLNLAGLYSTFALGHDHVHGLVPFFDFDAERNAPTVFSTALLCLGAYLFFQVARQERPGWDAVVWLLMSAIFGFMALDEFVTLHEHLGTPVREALGASGPFHYAWVIPYGIAAAVVGAICLPTLLRLRPPVRRRVVGAGAIYVTGALGLEMLEGWYASLHGLGSLPYRAMATVEESLEMLGLILLVHGLLVLLHDRGWSLDGGLQPDGGRASAVPYRNRSSSRRRDGRPRVLIK